jgi:hypothetical protein
MGVEAATVALGGESFFTHHAARTVRPVAGSFCCRFEREQLPCLSICLSIESRP